MYAEDGLAAIQLDPSFVQGHRDKNSLKSLQLKRAAWLEDYLYLPSHITFNQRAEVLRKYGPQSIMIEKDVSNIPLTKQCARLIPWYHLFCYSTN